MAAPDSVALPVALFAGLRTESMICGTALVSAGGQDGGEVVGEYERA